MYYIVEKQTRMEQTTVHDFVISGRKVVQVEGRSAATVSKKRFFVFCRVQDLGVGLTSSD